MHSRAVRWLLTILRVTAGAALLLMSGPLLIQGGFSRWAKYGIPARADWRALALAVAMLAVGGFLVRPYWWRRPGRR